jgi:hypothetical protein
MQYINVRMRLVLTKGRPNYATAMAQLGLAIVTMQINCNQIQNSQLRLKINRIGYCFSLCERALKHSLTSAPSDLLTIFKLITAHEHAAEP